MCGFLYVLLLTVLDDHGVQIQRHGATQALDLSCSCWAFFIQTTKGPSRFAPLRLDGFQEESEMKGPASDVPMHEYVPEATLLTNVSIHQESN